MIKIAPSILSADFTQLGNEVLKIEEAGADLLHIDVMDGHFVPNITIGPPIIKALRKVSGLVFDVHLMMIEPEKYIESFVDAGAGIISVHVEICHHIHRVLQNIRQLGIKPAIALNPGTSLSTIDCILEDVDMVLLMTVNPGFGGQEYIKAVTSKIKDLKRIIDARGLDVDIEVDGGIDLTNINEITNAGANVIVSGSTVFNAPNTAEIIKALRAKAYTK